MSSRKKISLLVSGLVLILILAAAFLLGSHISQTFDQEDVQLTEDTVRRYAVQCYALEGAYPESLEYLADNYTLTLNKDKYVYHYDYIGANMMPDISVFPIEGN